MPTLAELQYDPRAEMQHQPFTPPNLPGREALMEWGRGVKERTLHPLEALAGAAQRTMDDPTAAALDWSSPMAGSLSGLAGIFAGKSAKTADLAKLLRAEELAKAGVPDAQIWKETGWTFGFPDKMPRFEIPDVDATMKASQTGDIGRHEYGSVITHPELTQAYPTMQDIQFSHERSAYFNPNENRIAIDKAVTGKLGDQQIARAQERIYKVAAKMQEKGTLTDSAEKRLSAMLDAIGNNPRLLNSADTKVFDKSTTLHELQHAIQQREGFARGGSPQSMTGYVYEQINNPSNPVWVEMMDAKARGKFTKADKLRDKLIAQERANNKLDAYRSLAGEAEARLTQARMNMTSEQRLHSYPYQPEYFQQATGVPFSDLIVRQQ